MSVARSTMARGKSGKRARGKLESRCPDCPETPGSPPFVERSLEELTSLRARIIGEIGEIVCRSDGRLTRGMLQKLNEGSATGTSATSRGKRARSRKSVIVINDSDNEATNGDSGAKTNDRSDRDTSLSVIKCVSKQSKPSKPSLSPREERKSRIPAERKTNRLSVISLDNDSSVLDASNAQESLLGGENIAPTQTEDDVVELWSCLKKSNHIVNKGRRNARCNRDEMKAIFTIDKRPNLKYLSCLSTEVKYAQKRKRNQGLSYDITYESIIKSLKQKTSEYCDNSPKRKRRCYDSLGWSPAKLNRSNKKINSKEKNGQENSTHKLREIIVDGCNVAMAHTNGKEFSEKGIQIVVDYFKLKGHVVKVFLPQHIRRKTYTFLEQLYKEGTVVFTPSRIIDGRKITSYDDRYILKYATSVGGIVISSDQYRDLYREKPEWRNTILNRLLIPTFVGDYIMFPEDPLGRSGPNLDTFLRH